METRLWSSDHPMSCADLNQTIGHQLYQRQLWPAMLNVPSLFPSSHYGDVIMGDSVSNHQPRDCLLNRLVRRRSKKTPKVNTRKSRVTGLCAGNSPGTGEFSAQMASYEENVSIWWRHHVTAHCLSSRPCGWKGSSDCPNWRRDIESWRRYVRGSICNQYGILKSGDPSVIKMEYWSRGIHLQSIWNIEGGGSICNQYGILKVGDPSVIKMEYWSQGDPSVIKMEYLNQGICNQDCRLKHRFVASVGYMTGRLFHSSVRCKY